MKNNLVISLPVFNESSGIVNFVEELLLNFQDVNVKIVIVNDCSTDQTLYLLEANFLRNKNVMIISNHINFGHGLSTLKGLEDSIKMQCDHVLTCDGDGQISGFELRSGYDFFLKNNQDILEGVRYFRTKTFYRKMVSFFTIILVGIKVGKFPKDANTPFRIYKRHVLINMLRSLPERTSVPNLMFSIQSRRQHLDILNYPVETLPRRGDNEESVSWQSKFRNFPSKKFLRFCVKSFIEIIRF